jgi:hypothetical protein
LSVKVTESLVVVRDQPSGNEIVNPPAFERYGTNWLLSGMSPGGLLSAGTGDSAGRGETLCPLGDREWVLVGGPLVVPGEVVPKDAAGVLELAHATRSADATIAAMIHRSFTMGAASFER